MKKIPIWIELLACAQLIHAQTIINGSRTIMGNWDASGANSTRPAKQGTLAVIPASCSIGEEYFATDAPAGSNKYFCGSPNVWTKATAALTNQQSGVSYTILDSDRGKLITFSNSGSIAVTLPAAGSGTPATFVNGWYADLQNRGNGTVTMTTSGNSIDGVSTLLLTHNQGVRIFSDGSNYYTQRGVGGAGGSGTVTNTLGLGLAGSVIISNNGNDIKATGVVIDALNNVAGAASYFAGDGTSAGEFDYCELAVNGSNCLILKSPDARSTSLTGIWPVADPAGGEVMAWSPPVGPAGNTISQLSFVHKLSTPAGTGIAVATGSDASNAVTIAGTTNEIAVTNGDGSAGNPAIAIAPVVDLTGHTATRPIKAGLSAAAPANCQANQDLYIKTDATAGQQIFICNAAGTGWNIVGDGAGQGGTAIRVGGSAIAGTTANFSSTAPALPGLALAGGIIALPQQDAGSPTTNISYYVPPGTLQRPASQRKYFMWGCSVGAASVRSSGVTDNFGLIGSSGSCHNADSTHVVQYWSLNSGTAANSIAGGSGDLVWRRNGNHIHLEAWVGLSSISTSPMRYVFGISDASASVQTGADTVANQNYAILEFSQATDASHWICASNNGSSTAPAIITSTITTDTAMHLLTMDMEDTTPQIVFKQDGAPICTLTNSLPTASVFGRVVSAVNNLSSGSSVTISTGALEVDSGNN